MIATRNLGIRYSVYRSRTRSLKRKVFQFLSRELKRTEFWALRNVTMEIHEGDALGVIGENGAGKSTLGMALAEILAPDEGEVTVRGTVAPILTLGAGFDKDMTGRENIYLSGALMGYEPHEIREMERDIVSFAGLGDFIHNPIRAYSSGMRARLGFAVRFDSRRQKVFYSNVQMCVIVAHLAKRLIQSGRFAPHFVQEDKARGRLCLLPTGIIKPTIDYRRTHRTNGMNYSGLAGHRRLVFETIEQGKMVTVGGVEQALHRD